MKKLIITTMLLACAFAKAQDGKSDRDSIFGDKEKVLQCKVKAPGVGNSVQEMTVQVKAKLQKAMGSSYLTYDNESNVGFDSFCGEVALEEGDGLPVNPNTYYRQFVSRKSDTLAIGGGFVICKESGLKFMWIDYTISGVDIDLQESGAEFAVSQDEKTVTRIKHASEDRNKVQIENCQILK